MATDNQLILLDGIGARTTKEADQTGIPLLTAGVVSVAVAGTDYQAADADLATIAGLTATTGNVIQSVGSAWASRTPVQLRETMPAGYGFPLVTGNIYDQSCSYSVANWSGGGLTANRLYASLIYFPKSVTFVQIGTRVTAGVGSALGRVALYSVGTDGLPGALYWQGSTTIDMSTTNTNATVTGQTCAVVGGTWYYAALISDSAVSVYGGSGNIPNHGYSGHDSVTKITDYFKTNGSLTLPDPFGTPTGSSTGIKRVSFLVP